MIYRILYINLKTLDMLLRCIKNNDVQ